MDLDASAIADQEATVCLALLWKVFLFLLLSCYNCAVYEAESLLEWKCHDSTFVPPVVWALELCCGASAEGAVSSELFLKQCQVCLWPGPFGDLLPQMLVLF